MASSNNSSNSGGQGNFAGTGGYNGQFPGAGGATNLSKSYGYGNPSSVTGGTSGQTEASEDYAHSISDKLAPASSSSSKSSSSKSTADTWVDPVTGITKTVNTNYDPNYTKPSSNTTPAPTAAEQKAAAEAAYNSYGYGNYDPGWNNQPQTSTGGFIDNQTGSGPWGDQPRQFGGPVAPRGGYTVGENGPERFIPNRPGTIVPNNPADRRVMLANVLDGRRGGGLTGMGGSGRQFGGPVSPPTRPAGFPGGPGDFQRQARDPRAFAPPPRPGSPGGFARPPGGGPTGQLAGYTPPQRQAPNMPSGDLMASMRAGAIPTGPPSMPARPTPSFVNGGPGPTGMPTPPTPGGPTMPARPAAPTLPGGGMARPLPMPGFTPPPPPGVALPTMGPGPTPPTGLGRPSPNIPTPPTAPFNFPTPNPGARPPIPGLPGGGGGFGGGPQPMPLPAPAPGGFGGGARLGRAGWQG